MAMSTSKVAQKLSTTATRYTKMTFKRKQMIRRKGLQGFNSPEEVCIEWIGLEMSMISMFLEMQLVFNKAMTIKVHSWLPDGISVRSDIDVWFKGAPLKWKIHVWPIKGHMIWFDCNRWVAKTGLHPNGRRWEWRSEAHVFFKSKGTSTNFGIKVDRTNRKAGAG